MSDVMHLRAGRFHYAIEIDVFSGFGTASANPSGTGCGMIRCAA
jgi:hypothetical protein